MDNYHDPQLFIWDVMDPGYTTYLYLLHTHTHTHTVSPLHTAPSDHILTKLELPVLATLLATYTDEKLKDVKYSIQEKQGGNISREEVKRSLRQSGLTLIADGLKEYLEKGDCT